jgi:hypothetical protein
LLRFDAVSGDRPRNAVKLHTCRTLARLRGLGQYLSLRVKEINLLT